MGIQGLLPLLKECSRVAHIKEYKGQTLGVDAYVWLHRGAYGCAQEIATGQPTVKYVKYAIHKIRLLRHHGVTPYVVFDGGLLPSKQGTETDREARRNEAIAKARALTVEGKHAQAREYYVKAVDVTPQMAYQLIKALIAEGVSYVVAPYEADAQLAYLEKKAIIDGIITEDSDLLVFGCRKVLFKLDSDGQCVEVKRDNFTACKEFSFSGWTDKEFRQMAILSGCDYLESIQGLGLKTAHRLMRRYKTAEKVIRFVRLEGQLKVPRNYEEEFKRAELTFLHQRVFCPESRKLVHLEDLPDEVVSALSSPPAHELKFVGPFLSDEIALGIARGDICPLSKAKMIDIAPHAEVLAAMPKALSAQQTNKGTLKDFFKTEPAAPAKSSSKRDALGELKPNNLFSSRKEETNSDKAVAVNKPHSKPVKSRFFVPASKQGSKPQLTSREVVEISESDEGPVEEIREAKQDSGTCQQGKDSLVQLLILRDDGQIKEDLHSEHEIEQPLANPDQVVGSAVAWENQSFHQHEWPTFPTINTSPEVALLNIVLPPMPTPQRAAPPDDPEASGSGSGFSHISSPATSSVNHRFRKLRRYKSESPQAEILEGSGDSRVFADDDPTPVLSSPAYRIPMQDGLRVNNDGRAEAIIDSPIIQSEADDVTSSPPHVSQERPPGKRIKIRLSSPGDLTLVDESSLNYLWQSDAVTSDADMDVTMLVAESSSADSPAMSNKSRSLEMASDGVKSAGRQRKAKEGRVPRRNGVALPKQRVIKSITIEEDEEEGSRQMADFDRRLKTVVAGWRDKFAPVSAAGKQTRAVSRKGSRNVSPKLHVRPVLSPMRPTKLTNTQQEVSSPIVSSPPQEIATSYISKNDRRQEALDLPYQKAAVSLSHSTARALEAFRFRPSSSSSFHTSSQ